MTKPEETTAALIARLHNELEAARKGIERLIGERDYHKKVQAEAQDGHDHALNMLRAAMRERDEQRARAESAERARELSAEAAWRRGERLSNISNLCTAAGWVEKLGEDEFQQVNRCIRELKGQAIGQQKRADNLASAIEELRARAEKAECERDKLGALCDESQKLTATTLHQRDEARERLAATSRLLAERTRERDEARVESLQAGLVGREMEESLDAVTAECVKAQDLALRHSQDCDRALKERDEAREQLGRVQADYQVFMLGTAHGAKCWADECGWHCDEGCKAKHARKCVAAHELKDAREQLAKLEWSAFRRPDCGGPLSVCCPSCQGVKRGHEVGSAFKRDEVGHRPTCWFAKKKAAKEAGSNDKAERYPFPKRAGIGEVTVTVGEPARPEPRFKVGEKVKDFTGQIWNIDGAEFRTNPLYGPAWWYFWNNGRNAWTKETALERVDKPAPKFAVGEWVTHGDKAGEIIERYAAEGSWIYKLSDAPAIGHWEQTIIAQTPQHKHGCKGSIFLGRHEGFDLWWRPTMREVVAVDPAVAYYYSVDGELLSRNPLAIEARRRAVARGLVKP